MTNVGMKIGCNILVVFIVVILTLSLCIGLINNNRINYIILSSLEWTTRSEQLHVVTMSHNLPPIPYAFDLTGIICNCISTSGSFSTSILAALEILSVSRFGRSRQSGIIVSKTIQKEIDYICTLQKTVATFFAYLHKQHQLHQRILGNL